MFTKFVKIKILLIFVFLNKNQNIEKPVYGSKKGKRTDFQTT